MGNLPSRYRLTLGRAVVVVLLLYVIVMAIVRYAMPAPSAVGLVWPKHPAHTVRFVSDDSWLDGSGDRILTQSLFDELFSAVNKAQTLIVLDMFLFNDWQGPTPETHRALAKELTQVLVERKRQVPDINIVVITDPINTVYSGLQSAYLKQLRSAGVEVVMTALERLQDSNPLWSGFWRIFIAPFGNSSGSLLANPFGEGRVSLRSYLALLNFKANHRKLLVADNGKASLTGFVSSANPHDGSSAHRNVGLIFSGKAAHDLLASELQLLEMSEADHIAQSVLQSVAALETQLPTQALSQSPIQSPIQAAANTEANGNSVTELQILSESRILAAVLGAINSANTGDLLDLAMFYLSERKIVKALKSANARGATIRVLLDVNADAFGRAKNGIPNRPVAAELHKAGVSVRWCATAGEQCHAKWFHLAKSDQHLFILGSANYTRRNLYDLNMETNVAIFADSEQAISLSMNDYFDRQWNNLHGRIYSTDYDRFADDSFWLTLQYRFMEATGISTF